MTYSQVINVVTDCRPGEPDIILGREFEPLLVVREDGELVKKVLAPEGGWTRIKIVLCPALTVVSEDVYCFDALLGDTWIGSTEV